MVHIQNEIAAALAGKLESKVPKGAKIELTKPLPENLQGKNIIAKVEAKLPNGNYTLQLKNGNQIEAKISPEPKLGSQISFIAPKTGEAKITEMVVDSLKNNNEGENKQATEQKPGNNPNTNNTAKKEALVTITTKQAEVLTEKALQSTATDVAKVHKTDPFSQLRPLIGQKVTLSLPKGQVLPQSNNVISVVVSKPENGLQTLQPQSQTSAAAPSNLPPFQAKFPVTIPEGTVIKMNISASKGEILEITPPKVSAPTTTQTATTAKAETQATLPTLPKSEQNLIILSSKVTDIKAPLPIGAQVNIKVTTPPAQATQLPNQIVTSTLNNGEIKTESVPRVSQTAITSGSVKLTITGQTAIPEGTEMAIKITGASSADIVQVNKDSSIGDKPQGNQTGNQGKQGEHQPSFKPGSSHTGTITGQSDNGKITLTLKDGQKIEVQAPKPLPLGTKITVVISDDGIPEITEAKLPQSVAKAVALTHLSNKWQALLEGLNALKFANPKSAEGLKNNLPNLENNTFLPNLITFIDAVNNQSMERLAGNETLNLLKALGIDFSADMHNIQASTQKNSDSPDNWRALLFPYVENEGDDPKQGGFFWHNQENGNSGTSNTTFIVHLELSHIGAVQVDGLIQDKSIHLKLKTGKKLDDADVQGLKSVVRQTLEKLELTGDIQVLEERASPEKPLSVAIKEAEQFKVTI